MLGIVIGAGDILVNRTSKLPILRNLNFFQWWLLLLLSHFSCVRLCDPIDGSPLDACPWDSLGKNTGVGCHFLLQGMKVKSESKVTQSCLTLCEMVSDSSRPHGL